MKLSEIFTKNLKLRMNELHLNQPALAKKMRIDASQISKYAGGKHEPRFEQLEAFAAALDVHPSFFLSEGIQAPRIALAPPQPPPSDEDIVARVCMSMLSKGDRKDLILFLLATDSITASTIYSVNEKLIRSQNDKAALG